MRELSIGEIADILSLTKRATEMRATRESWRYRVGTGTGRPRFYDLADLPPDVRFACASAQLAAIDVPLPVAQAAEAEPEAERLSSAAAEARDARLAIMVALDRFTREGGLSRARADALFCKAFEVGSIEVAEWVRASVRTITPRTLFRWRAARKAGETHRLGVDKGAARRGRGALDIANDGEVRAVILAHMAQNPFLSADHVRTVVKDRFGEVLDIGGDVVPLPTVRTFQMALKTWRQTYAAELMALTNPDAFKDRLRVSGRSAHLVSRCNELWAIDASPADVLTKDGRYSIYVAIDVFSRRLMVHVTKTPRSAAVCLLMRRAIIAWGVPERVKTDNGSDFVAKATQRVMAGLGIEVELSAPFSPWQKGTIERAIGTVQRDLMRTLPGFIGHSVSDRKAIEGRRAFAQRLGCDPDKAFVVDLTPDELQDYCDRWAEDRYAHRPHSGLGGQTPFVVASADRTTIRRPDIRALDMLLAPIAGSNGIRVVGKEGVQIDYTKYVVAAVPVGTEVLVRMDPADMGRAFLFDPAGESYLGEAIAPELAGIDPAEAVRRAQAEQKSLLAERTKELRRIKVKPRDVADAIRREASGHAATLLTFPKREEAYTTPALDAAAEATAPPAPPAQMPIEIRELQQRLLAEENVTPIRREENPHDRWKRACAIAERMGAGQPVAPADVLWLGGYREGSEFKGFALTYGDPLEKENPAEAGI
ncbi:DDE-type integrase/transposase/recombinase [Ancylobacter sp. G4_0304]|uniref:DDE-type integrase/transposase/recombinase n=1 Tax=Ancylobacter sp. G4_0304 TaxID=3114289 RepID=UPI0039C5AB0A